MSYRDYSGIVANSYTNASFIMLHICKILLWCTTKIPNPSLTKHLHDCPTYFTHVLFWNFFINVQYTANAL